jgi:hypothetical protein
MWILPTYGRPERLKAIFDAPGGMPPNLVVFLTGGDPELRANRAICLERKVAYFVAPDHDARLGFLLRLFSGHYPNEQSYGLVTDDHWPITRYWWEMLEGTAGDRFMAYSVDPEDTSPLPGAPCFGGDLVRAMGSFAPGQMLHNYIDNAWRTIGEDFGLLRPRQDVLIQHHHPIRGQAKEDPTHRRGSWDIEMDEARFRGWMTSKEREESYQRIAGLLGVKPRISDFDLSKVRLALCLPLADGRIDVALDRSLCDSLELCTRHGMSFAKHVITGGSNVGYTRELLMAAALRSDCTHVMMVDDDMAWDEPTLLATLIAADHDFAAVVGVKKLPGPTRFCCQFFDGDQPVHPRSGFLQVKTVGFGLVVIKREVFEKMVAAYPKLRYDAHGTEPAGHALFCETIQVDPTGKRLRMTEDMAFCSRWTALGGEIWVDHQATLRHIGRFDYAGRIADVLEVAPQQEAAE